MRLSSVARMSLAVWLVVACVMGCNPTLRIPEDLVATRYSVPYAIDEVRETCLPTLRRCLEAADNIEISALASLATYVAARPDALVHGQSTTNPDLVTCTLVEDYSATLGQSKSGKAEHWNVLLTDRGGETELDIYRHMRWRDFGVPLSDGRMEQRFVEALKQAIEEARHGEQ